MVPKETVDVSFRVFVDDCVHHRLLEPMTFEEWVRKKTILDPLRVEYIHWGAVGSIRKDPQVVNFRGNFYDWMARIKGIELTAEEAQQRIHRAPLPLRKSLPMK